VGTLFFLFIGITSVLSMAFYVDLCRICFSLSGRTRVAVISFPIPSFKGPKFCLPEGKGSGRVNASIPRLSTFREQVLGNTHSHLWIYRIDSDPSISGTLVLKPHRLKIRAGGMWGHTFEFLPGTLSAWAALQITSKRRRGFSGETACHKSARWNSVLV